MDPNAPFFPLRNPIKDEDAPQKKRKRSRADGEDTAGSLSLPARTSDLLPYPVQETSASPRASTSSSVAADAQTAAAEGSSLTRPPSSTSNLGIERAGPHQTTKSESLPPSTQPSHCRSLSESTLPQISPAHPCATSLPQAVSPDPTPRQALTSPQDQAAPNTDATAAAESPSSSSSLPAPSESRCVRWTEEEKKVLRESLKRELATGRDADYTRALTKAVNDFLQAFPHTSRTCSAIRQAARSLAAAQRDSQGGHGRQEEEVIAARASLPQVAQAQTDHHALRGTSDQRPGNNGEAAKGSQSKGGSHASPASSLPVSKTTAAQLPPQRPHAAQLQRNAAPSGFGSGSINNASSVGMESGAGGQHTPVCAAPSTRAMPRRTGSPVHTGPRTTRQQLFLPPFPTSFPPGEAFAAASITSTPGSSSSAANERPAQDGCAATLPGPAATSDTQAAASSSAARAPASSSATKEDGASGARTSWLTGPLDWPWEKSGQTAKVSTRCLTSSGRPGAPSPEPRSTSTSTGVASSPTFSTCSSIGSGGGWSGPYRPFDLTRGGVPTFKTHFPPRPRASPAPKRTRLSAEPEEMSSSLHVGIMNHCDDDVQFVECPPNRHIAVYNPYCVKITRDPPPSSGIPSFGRICKPIFALRGGEAGNYQTVQMPEDVEMSAKTVSAKHIARSGVVAAMDTIFRSAANNLSVVLRLEVRRVRSDGREGR